MFHLGSHSFNDGFLELPRSHCCIKYYNAWGMYSLFHFVFPRLMDLRTGILWCCGHWSLFIMYNGMGDGKHIPILCLWNFW